MFHNTAYEVNKAQILLLTSCSERNDKLGKGEITDEREERALWSEIVQNLNSIGGKKTLEEWKKVWLQLVENTREKHINMIDIRIMKIFDGFPEHVTTCMRSAEGLAVSNQREEIYVVEENPKKTQNQYLAHMVGIFNAQTRVAENGFRMLNKNMEKIAKRVKRN